jgi:hypothetical protein
VHPPPSPARTNFTLITECTRQKAAVATLCTLWVKLKNDKAEYTIVLECKQKTLGILRTSILWVVYI